MNEKPSVLNTRHLVDNFYLDVVPRNYVLYENVYNNDTQKHIFKFSGYFGNVRQLVREIKEIVCKRKITSLKWHNLIEELERINNAIENTEIYNLKRGE